MAASELGTITGKISTTGSTANAAPGTGTIPEKISIAADTANCDFSSVNPEFNSLHDNTICIDFQINNNLSDLHASDAAKHLPVQHCLICMSNIPSINIACSRIFCRDCEFYNLLCNNLNSMQTSNLCPLQSNSIAQVHTRAIGALQKLNVRINQLTETQIGRAHV